MQRRPFCAVSFLLLLGLAAAWLLVQQSRLQNSNHVLKAANDRVAPNVHEVLEGAPCAQSSDDPNNSTSAGNLTDLTAFAKRFGSVCQGRKCLAAFHSVSDGAERVPRIRHILWKSDQVSAYFARQLRTWAAIQPSWTYVLWRDADLEKFVAKHYTGVLGKFRSLRHHIMRVDMVRYMILHHFGGVYADLDYVLVRPLDPFLKYPAVVPGTTEAIAMVHFGMSCWPPPILGNPAFMISEPRHPFFFFCILQLAGRNQSVHLSDVLEFAGPLGLSAMMKRYATDFPAAANPNGIVFVPASRAFDAFENNSIHSSTTVHKGFWVDRLNSFCKDVKSSNSAPVQLKTYCQDVYNLDPITDRSELAYAIHDINKLRTAYDPKGSAQFYANPVDIRSVLPKILMADEII